MQGCTSCFEAQLGLLVDLHGNTLQDHDKPFMNLAPGFG